MHTYQCNHPDSNAAILIDAECDDDARTYAAIIFGCRMFEVVTYSLN